MIKETEEHSLTTHGPLTSDISTLPSASHDRDLTSTIVLPFFAYSIFLVFLTLWCYGQWRAPEREHEPLRSVGLGRPLFDSPLSACAIGGSGLVGRLNAKRAIDRTPHPSSGLMDDSWSTFLRTLKLIEAPVVSNWMAY